MVRGWPMFPGKNKKEIKRKKKISQTNYLLNPNMSDIESKSVDDFRVKNNENVFIQRLERIPCCGLILSWISACCYATAGFTVELMDNVDPTFIVVSRSIIQLLFFLPVALCQGHSILGHQEERIGMCERCFFGFLCFVLAYYSFDYISFSDNQSIVFASPALVSFLGWVLLNETCSIIQIITMIITFIGVLLICRPTTIFGESGLEDQFTPQERVIGITLSILTCVTLSYCYIGMRKLKKTSTSAQNAGYSIFCIFAGSLVLNAFSLSTQTVIRTPSGLRGWTLILINGFCGVCGQATASAALRIEEAGLVSIMRTFDIVMAFIYQGLFLPQQPIHWTSILGAVLISSGCIVVSVKKYLDSRKSKKVYLDT